MPLVNIFLGEVVFGGVGSGLYGMLMFLVASKTKPGAGTAPPSQRPSELAAVR